MNRLRINLQALREALEKAESLCVGKRMWWLRESVRNAIDELDRIETGPENSREEVSPMGSSPQRDCATARLAAA